MPFLSVVLWLARPVHWTRDQYVGVYTSCFWHFLPSFWRMQIYLQTLKALSNEKTRKKRHYKTSVNSITLQVDNGGVYSWFVLVHSCLTVLMQKQLSVPLDTEDTRRSCTHMMFAGSLLPHHNDAKWLSAPLDTKDTGRSCTHMICAGSFLLLTQHPFSHRSFFLLGKEVLTYLWPAWVALTSHHGASVTDREQGNLQGKYLRTSGLHVCWHLTRLRGFWVKVWQFNPCLHFWFIF